MKYCLYTDSCFLLLFLFFLYVFLEFVRTHRLRRDLKSSVLLNHIPIPCSNSNRDIRRHHFSVDTVKVIINAFYFISHLNLFADPQSFHTPPGRFPRLYSRKIISKVPTSISTNNLLLFFLSHMVYVFRSIRTRRHPQR